MTVKALIGYDIVAGVPREEYDRWLYDVHVPDLLANPHLDRIVFNTVTEEVQTASGSDTAAVQAVSLLRVAELHFADIEAYRQYRAWFEEHPIPPERGVGGRSDFKFYVLCESETISR